MFITIYIYIYIYDLLIFYISELYSSRNRATHIPYMSNDNYATLETESIHDFLAYI